MAAEIELKARIADSDALRRVLDKKAEFMFAFEKDDAYWFPNGEIDACLNALPQAGNQRASAYYHLSKIRLRRERREFPDGHITNIAFATCKEKSVKDGIEVNDEHEFEVRPAEEFEAFLRKMGLIPGTAKKKRGWAFRCGEISSELVEVIGLGWFIELEIIVENLTPPQNAKNALMQKTPAGKNSAEETLAEKNLAEKNLAEKDLDEKTLNEKKERLLNFLAEIGIGKEAIESRFYSEMLSTL